MSAIDALSIDQEVVEKNHLRYLITVNDNKITLTRMNKPYWLLAAAVASLIISLFVLGIVFLILTLFFILYYFMQKRTFEFDKNTTEIRDTGDKLEFSVLNNRIYVFAKLSSNNIQDKVRNGKDTI
jgi:hypothetical protein